MLWVAMQQLLEVMYSTRWEGIIYISVSRLHRLFEGLLVILLLFTAPHFSTFPLRLPCTPLRLRVEAVPGFGCCGVLQEGVWCWGASTGVGGPICAYAFVGIPIFVGLLHVGHVAHHLSGR